MTWHVRAGATTMSTVRDDALRFFNELSGRIRIELSEGATRITPRLDNVNSPPEATIVSLSIEWEVFTGNGFRPLTDDEWSRVVLSVERIRIRGFDSKIEVEALAPDGECFTIRDLAEAVQRCEREARPTTNWFGGVDVHHVFFEGIHADADGVWDVRCGS